MSLVYKMANRSSLDFDFSIENDFSEKELPIVSEKLHAALESEFLENDLAVFDYDFHNKPENIKPCNTGFWGGYVASFKLASIKNKQRYGERLEVLRKKALRIDRGGKQKIDIEISKFEYCERREEELDDRIIYVYPPELLALEKIRAICQQTGEFMLIVPKPGIKGRAKDFFDIYCLCQTFNLNLLSTESINKLKEVFMAKNVPLGTLFKIEEYKNIHEITFASVINTVSTNTTLKDFSFYFDFVINVTRTLAKRLGIE